MTTESFGGRPPRYPDSPDAGRTVPSDPDSPDVGRRPPRYPDSPDDGRTVPSDPPDSPDAGRKVYPDSPDAGRKLPIDPDSPDAGRMVPTESFGIRSPRTDPDSPPGRTDPINLPPVVALPSLAPILLSEVLSTILAEPSLPTEPPLFRFEWDEAAQLHNGRLTAAHNWDLVTVIRLHPFCAVTPGSEFRQSRLLTPLLDSHPLWCRFLERIDVGSHHPLFPISEPDRLWDLHTMLSCGNHKSAKMHETK